MLYTVFDSILSNMMRFFGSTHLLMCLSLDTLTSILRTGWPILVELIDLVNCYNFSVSNNLNHVVNFPTWILDCDSHSYSLLHFFLSSYASICSTMAFVHWEILIIFLFQFPLTFQKTGYPLSLESALSERQNDKSYGSI